MISPGLVSKQGEILEAGEEIPPVSGPGMTGAWPENGKIMLDWRRPAAYHCYQLTDPRDRSDDHARFQVN